MFWCRPGVLRCLNLRTLGNAICAATGCSFLWSGALRGSVWLFCSLLATIEERLATDAVDEATPAEVKGQANRKPPSHIPLLQRAKEPSMQDRLHKLGMTAPGIQSKEESAP